MFPELSSCLALVIGVLDGASAVLGLADLCPLLLAVNLRSCTMTSSTSLSTPPSLHFPHITSLLCVVSVSVPLLLLLLCSGWMQ